MSTVNTRVIRNIVTFLSNATQVNSIMEVRLTDNTTFLKTGSDNDAAYRHWPGNYESSIEVVCEDPLEAQKVKGLSNQPVSFIGVDLATNTNVNCAVTSVAWGQVGLGAVYSEEAKASIRGNGGQITFS
jgi:hypothetical protein